MASSPRFRVAIRYVAGPVGSFVKPTHPYVISGGGIGGLALAAFICFHSNDIAVDIYETKDEISSIGAGIAIWKRTWQTLQDIGLEEEVKKRNLSLPKDGEGMITFFCIRRLLNFPIQSTAPSSGRQTSLRQGSIFTTI